MQTKKEDVKNRINQAALEEFYEKNYKSATMRSIAKRAGITVGLIYTYYQDKEALFEEIISPVFCYIKNKFNGTYQLFGEDRKIAEAEIIPKLLKWPRELVILFDKSTGSKYQHFSETMTEQLAVHIDSNLKTMKSDYCEIQAKILASCYLESLLVVARNYQSADWADKASKFVMNLLFYKTMD